MGGNKIGINVSIDPESVRSLGSLILSILESENDQATKQEALKIIPEVLKIKNVSIHGNSIDQREGAKAEEELGKEGT